MRQITLRVSESLHERIRRAAQTDGVSMNQWCISSVESRLTGGLRSADVKQLNELTADMAQVKKMLGIEGGKA